MSALLAHPPAHLSPAAASPAFLPACHSCRLPPWWCAAPAALRRTLIRSSARPCRRQAVETKVSVVFTLPRPTQPTHPRPLAAALFSLLQPYRPCSALTPAAPAAPLSFAFCPPCRWRRRSRRPSSRPPGGGALGVATLHVHPSSKLGWLCAACYSCRGSRPHPCIPPRPAAPPRRRRRTAPPTCSPSSPTPSEAAPAENHGLPPAAARGGSAPRLRTLQQKEPG